MKTKLLIGYDGSDGADAAIDDLSRSGLPSEAEAVVLSVAEIQALVAANTPFAPAEAVALGPFPAVLREVGEQAGDVVCRARVTARAGAERVRALFPGWTVTADAVAGSPWRELVERAAGWPADLVVVGSHGRSALGRLVLGSVSQKVLNHAACSVRVGHRRPGPADPARPIRVLLAVDGSADAAAAVRSVADRPWPAGTEVRAMTAVDPKLATLAWSICRLEEDAGVAAGVQRHAHAAATDLCEVGLAAVPIVLEGYPSHALAAEADRWGADCIVLGAKGHGGFERLLLGSVSAAVAARAGCSVEVVRGGGRDTPTVAECVCRQPCDEGP